MNIFVEKGKGGFNQKKNSSENHSFDRDKLIYILHPLI